MKTRINLQCNKKPRNTSRHLKTIQLRMLLAVLMILSVFFAKTAEVRATAEQSNQHIYDNAGLLSTTEVSDLEQLCIDYGSDAGIEIMILTHDDPDALYAEDYIEDFEDTLPVADRVYLLIDMQNRVVFMEGYGLCETYIHSKRIDVIIDEITPDLSEGNYFDACATYIKRSAAYMSDDSELNYDSNYTANTPQSSNPNAPNYDETLPSDYYSSSTGKNFLANVWIQLLAAVIIGAVTVAIMAYHSGGKMTTGSSTYMDQNHSGLIGRRDDYVRTQITRVRKPQNNNNNHGGGGFNAGGFRGGVSMGGRSHSSGGGKF